MIQNINGLNAKLSAMKAAAPGDLLAGLMNAGWFLQRESQKLVPVEFDVLRTTANTRPVEKGKTPAVRVGYGTDYAIYVHEDMYARHAPGTQAKYLEQPFREKRDRMMEIVVDFVRKGLP